MNGENLYFCHRFVKVVKENKGQVIEEILFYCSVPTVAYDYQGVLRMKFKMKFAVNCGKIETSCINIKF